MTAILKVDEITPTSGSEVTITELASSSVNITGGTIVGITDLAVADGGTGSSTAAGAATNLGLGTGDSPQFTAVNIGHATNNTLSSPSSGDLQIEANIIYRAGGTDVPVTDGGTGSSTAAGAATNLGLGTGNSPQFTAVNIGDAADTTVSRFGAGDIQVEANRVFRVGGADVPLADGGTGASLVDPNADRILFWDDSEGTVAFLAASTGLTITTTNLTATATPITLVASQSTASGTAWTFTGIPSGTKRIILSCIGFSTNGTSMPVVQIGPVGGIEITGYNSIGSTVVTGAADAVSAIGFIPNGAWGATVVAQDTYVLNLQDATSFTWTCYVSGYDSVNNQGHRGYGHKALAAELTQIRLTMTNGTDVGDAGVVSISYQ